MNKYAIVYYTNSWEDDGEIQKILLKYKELIPNKNLKGVLLFNTIKGLSVIASKGPTILKFVGDRYQILNSEVFAGREYDLELNEEYDKLFEAETDDDAKLIFEVSDDNI